MEKYLLLRDILFESKTEINGYVAKFYINRSYITCIGFSINDINFCITKYELFDNFIKNKVSHFSKVFNLVNYLNRKNSIGNNMSNIYLPGFNPFSSQSCCNIMIEKYIRVYTLRSYLYVFYTIII